MRDGWRETTLGEVCKLQRRRVDPRALPASQPLVHWSIPALDESGGPVVETASNIGSHKFAVPTDSVLVSLLNPRISRTAFVRGGANVVCSTEFAALSPNGPEVDVRFIEQTLSSPDFRGTLRSIVTGTTKSRERVRPADVMSIPILLPPLDEQRRIVDLIAAVDEAIEAAERERNAVGTALGTLIARFCFSDCTNSNTTQLKKVSKIVMGQSPPGDLCNKAGDGTPLLNGPTEFTDEVVGEPRQWTNSGTKFAETGDILICVRGATAGRLNEAAYPAAIGRGLAAVQAESKLDTAFVRFALLGRADQLLPAAGGTIFPNISGPALGGFELSWPADAIRIEVAQLLLEVERVKREATQASVTLRTLRSALLADLLSGDHEIPASYDALLSA